MKYRFIGQVEVININLGKRLKPNDEVEVSDENLIKRLDADALFEKVESKPAAKPKKDGD